MFLCSNLDTKIKNLWTEGCTALGPALAISAGIIASQPLSEVILCTDGEPNVGVGQIEGPTHGRLFYNKVHIHILYLSVFSFLF